MCVGGVGKVWEVVGCVQERQCRCVVWQAVVVCEKGSGVYSQVWCVQCVYGMVCAVCGGVVCGNGIDVWYIGIKRVGVHGTSIGSLEGNGEVPLFVLNPACACPPALHPVCLS